jgi:hypothetical protein
LKNNNVEIYYIQNKFKNIMGIGDWGLGIGPNPQSPIPNPQSPIPMIFLLTKIHIKLFIF